MTSSPHHSPEQLQPSHSQQGVSAVHHDECLVDQSLFGQVADGLRSVVSRPDPVLWTWGSDIKRPGAWQYGKRPSDDANYRLLALADLRSSFGLGGRRRLNPITDADFERISGKALQRPAVFTSDFLNTRVHGPDLKAARFPNVEIGATHD